MFTRALGRSPHRRTRRLARLGVALVLIAAPLVLLPTAASSDTGSALPSSPYNAGNGVRDSGPNIAGHDDVGTPDTFAGGVKEDTDCPSPDGGGAPDKSDILTAWVGNANAKVSGVDHTFLYLAWARPSDEGTATIDFELNTGTVKCSATSPFYKRVAGKDLLVTYDFQGGSTVGISVRTWTSTNQGGKWSPPVTLDASKAEADISDNQLFGELVIDMTAAGYFQPGVCQSFSSAMAKSRSSSASFENQVKDLILPFPIEVTNCGSLTVTKTVAGGSGSFNFTVDCGSFDLKPDAAGDDLTFPLGDGGSKLIPDIPLDTVCSVTESDPGAATWTTTYKIGSGPTQTGLVAGGITIALGNKTVAFTNTRNTGTLTVNKVLMPADDPGTFNLQIDGATAGSGANVGNGGTTGAVTVNTGTHTFGETAGTGTDLDNYVSSSVCLAGSTPVTIVAGNTVNVAKDQSVVCTITNTRKTGTLTVNKVVVPADDPGTFNLQIDGATAGSGANVGNGGTTGAVTVNTGTHTFGETAGTGTSLADYAAESSCLVGSTPVNAAAGSINVGHGQNVVCTITNTRRTGTLTVNKLLVPADDPGTFNLQIDGQTAGTGTNVGHNGTTGPIQVNTGPHSVGETAGSGTNLDDYANSIACRAGETSVTVTNGSISVGEQNVVCTITNTRKTGTLKVVKDLSPADDPGKFNLLIDSVVQASGVGDGGATPVVTVNTGVHSFGESAGTGTDLDDYTSTAACVDGTGPVNTSGGSVTVAHNQNVVCTITNTRKTGTLTVNKVLVPSSDPGKFNLQIDGATAGSGGNVGNGGTTGKIILNTGTHSFGETAGTDSDLDDYITTSACLSGESTVTITDGSVQVGHNQDIVCTITNIRRTGSLTVAKTTSGGSGTFTFDVVCDNGLTTVVVIEDSGAETIEGIPTRTSCTVTERDNPLFGSTVIPANGTVVIDENGETVAFTNTRITGPLTITKTVVGGTGTFTFDVNCSDDSFDQAVTIDGSGSKTITGIPSTTSCTVTERDNPLFTAEASPANGTVTISAGGANVGFVNTAKPIGIRLDKKVNRGDHASPGDALVVHGRDALAYTVTITNTGEVPLRITALSDSLYSAFVAACPQAIGSVLAAGASFTCSYGATAITDAHNVAAVSAVDDLGRPVGATDGTYVDVINPAISIVKTAAPESISVSGTVTYTYVVTNTGDTPLQNVLVTDDVLGAIGTVGQLAVGESVTFAKTVDVDALTPPRNIGTAVGTDQLGQTVSASDDAVITVVLGAVLAQPELPRTGAPLGAQTRAALAMIEVGIVLTLAGRRRRGGRRAD
jgi:hypothetical protein